ncbi:MAG: DUF4831 family protein [Candidatus Cryptobacteroides sp.]|nr:DUF4831 family protein [Candidatus Cryptobacteroides sp.]
MKKLFVAAALLLPVVLPAQEVSYALPSTSITVKVEVRQETFFAGPYAPFAKQMLNMSVSDQDAITTEITRVELIPRVEADTDAWYTCDQESSALLSLSAQGLVSLGNAAAPVSWRFLPGLKADFTDKGLTAPDKEAVETIFKEMPSDTGMVSIPVEHKILVEKTLEDKALDAADVILQVRKERLNIASGNTDASYSGESLRAALQELERIEAEYMALFRGYSVVRKQVCTFEVIPSRGVKHHRYLVFRLTDDGPVTEGVSGTPYYLELQPEGKLPEEDHADKKKTRGSVRYRIPQVCKVTFSCDGHPLLQTRLPFYQLGVESSLSLLSR